VKIQAFPTKRPENRENSHFGQKGQREPTSGTVYLVLINTGGLDVPRSSALSFHWQVSGAGTRHAGKWAVFW
jgi:hypothetical protein